MLARLIKEDITADIPVEWPVYSSSGRLLLQSRQWSNGLFWLTVNEGVFLSEKGNKQYIPCPFSLEAHGDVAPRQFRHGLINHQ